jgi:hypothetical protein
VYIVQSGEFEVTKRFKREQEKEVDITRLLNHKKHKEALEQVAKGAKGSLIKQETSTYEGSYQQQESSAYQSEQQEGKKQQKTSSEKTFKSGYNSNMQLAPRQRNVETFKIAILGAGQMFGDDDLVHER